MISKATAMICVLAVIGAVGDSCVKCAVSGPRWLCLAGAAIYGAMALGWFEVFKYRPMATSAALYGVVTALILAILGTAAFGERPSGREWFGILLAVTAIALLGR